MMSIKKYLKSLINASGFDLVRHSNDRLGYELEEEALASIDIIKNNTMLSKRRLITLYQQVVHCEKNNIEGDFVECGVWKGGAVGLMALANLSVAPHRKRHLHLFDAFQEICEPDANIDGDRALNEMKKFTGKTGHDKGRLQSVTGVYDWLGGPGTLEENKNLLEKIIAYPSDYIHYHKGWFQETVPSNQKSIKQIAILRLDGDWYASTKVCLDYLFNKVVKGGVVIIDDYGTYDGCRRAVDEFLAARGLNLYLHSIDSDARYIIK